MKVDNMINALKVGKPEERIDKMIAIGLVTGKTVIKAF